MRKFITVMLSFVLVLATFTCTVEASEYTEYIQSNVSNFEGEADVSYHMYSTYEVTIPTSITDETGAGTISVTMDNIEDGYHIEVYVTNLNTDGYLPVTSEDGNTAYLAVMYDNAMRMLDYTGSLATFYPVSYNYTGSATVDVSFAESGTGSTKAGTYTGAICFRVECVED